MNTNEARGALKNGPEQASPPKRTRRTILTMAIALFSVIIVGLGGVGSYALWTTMAGGTASAKGAQIALTTSNFTTIDASYGNHLISATGGFTVTDTTVSASTTSRSYTATLSASGSVPLAQALAVTVWPTSDAASCSASTVVSGTATSGTWSSIAPITGTVAAGASAHYCVRSSASERGRLASTAGTLSITPKLSATLGVGNWTATAVATASQSTSQIYPATTASSAFWYQIKNVGTAKCASASGGSTSSGTALVDQSCTTGTASSNYRQWWKFTAGTGDYLTVTPRHAVALRMDTASAGVGSAAQVITASSTERQQWQLQTVGGGTYQLVNKLSGYCLDTRGGSTVVQAVCDGNAAQRFTLTQGESTTPTGYAFVCGGTQGAANATVPGYYLDLRWTLPTAGENYVVKFDGTTTSMQVADWGSTRALQLGPGDFPSYPTGPVQLTIHRVDGSAQTQVISQRILVSYDQYNNRLIACG